MFISFALMVNRLMLNAIPIAKVKNAVKTRAPETEYKGTSVPANNAATVQTTIERNSPQKIATESRTKRPITTPTHDRRRRSGLDASRTKASRNERRPVVPAEKRTC
jgi:hypothetical protein